MHVHISIALLSLLFMKVTTAQKVASYAIAGYGTSAALPSISTDISLLVNVTNPFVLHLAGSTCMPNVKVCAGNEKLKLFCKAPLGNHYIILEPGQPAVLKISNLRETTTATVWPYFILINQSWETTLDAVNSRVYPTGYIASHRDLTKKFQSGLDSQFTLGYFEGTDNITMEYITFKIGTSPYSGITLSLANVNTFRIINGTSNKKLYTCANINHPPSSYVTSAAYLSTLRFRFVTNSNSNDGFLIKYSVQFQPRTTTRASTSMPQTSQTQQPNSISTVSAEKNSMSSGTSSQNSAKVVAGTLSGAVGLTAILVLMFFMIKRQRTSRAPKNGSLSGIDQPQTTRQQNENTNNRNNEDGVDEDPYCTPGAPTDSHQYSVLNIRATDTGTKQKLDTKHQYANVKVESLERKDSADYANIE